MADLSLSWDELDPALTWGTIDATLTWDQWGVFNPEPVPPPYIPPELPVIIPRPAHWAFITADPGGPITELTHARSRSYTARLRGPDELHFTMDALDRQSFGITELETDLLAYRNGELMFRGRVGPSADQAGPTRHTVNFAALDYAAVLQRRLVIDGDGTLDAEGNPVRRYTQVDQEAIGWALIDYTQFFDTLGITRGAGQSTGVLRDRDYHVGKPINEAVQELSEVTNGFDWAIDPDRIYRVWYPERGTVKNEPLDYGGTVSGFSRSFNPERFSNTELVSGADNTTIERRTLASYGPAGRWERHTGLPDVTLQTTLAQHADRLHAEGLAYSFDWTLTMSAGKWRGPDHLWLGDTATLVVRSGRLDVVADVRVAEISFVIGENGGEEVQITVEQHRPSITGRLSSLDRRLSSLERFVQRK